MPFVPLSPKEERRYAPPCTDPQHNPPNAIMITHPVKWRCPACNRSVILRPTEVRCEVPTPTRTRSQVLGERGTVVGCCNRYADMSGCDCLETAACDECNGSGWAVHPENGWTRTARRCSRGCPSNCGICRNPNCDNPNGQH